jgi:hypothetical protein
MLRYLEALEKFAREDLPALEYDINNASTLFTLQAAVKKLHAITAYTVHHSIYFARGFLQMQQGQVVAPPPPVPVQAAPVRQAAPQAPFLPTSPVLPGLTPTPNPEQPKVMDVTITPRGTQVTVPGQPAAFYPPGAEVDAAALMAPPPPSTSSPALSIPGGPVAEIVLPRGGALTQEVASAIGQTGGARNITDQG